MALATQCPHCSKRFRVAADQLKLRGGIVRCGACHEIFDGSAALIDLDALAAQRVSGSAPVQPTAAIDPAQGPAPARGAHAGPAQPAASPVPEHSPGNDTGPVPPDHDLDGVPIYTLDFDHTFDPFGILPGVEEAPAQVPATEAPQTHIEPAPGAGREEVPAQGPDTQAPQANVGPAPEPQTTTQQSASPPLEGTPVPAEPAPIGQPDDLVTPVPSAHAAAAPEPAGHAVPIGSTLELPVDEELVAAALPDHDDFDTHETARQQAALDAIPAPLPLRESAPDEPPSTPARARSKAAEARLARRARPAAASIVPSAPALPAADEPEFVKRSRQQEESGKSRRLLLAAGSVVLLLVLVAQSVATFRNVLAARFPAAKPALVAACAALRCRVELPARIESLTIDQGELTGLGNNSYSLATLLHNQDALVQAWPHVELTLTDANDKPLLRRVIAPVEYLPPRTPLANGFAAHAEQPVKLTFQLDQLKPSGYSIVVFYP